MAITSNLATFRVEDLEVDLKKTARPEDISSVLRWQGDTLVHVGVRSANCSNFNFLDHPVALSLRHHIIAYSFEKNYSASTLLSLAYVLCQSLGTNKHYSFDKAWILEAISLPSYPVVSGCMKAFFLYWRTRYQEGVGDDVLQIMARKAFRPKRPRNVLSDDPEKSWLTDLEYDALIHSIWENYSNKNIGVQTTLLRLLSMQYARRPIQFSHLKFGDFREHPHIGDDIGGRRVSFPGAKDRKAENNFRDSKVELHPIADHLWDLYLIQRSEAKKLFGSVFGFLPSDTEIDQLPVFTDKAQIESAIYELTNHYQVDWRKNLQHRLFHMKADVVGWFISWRRSNSLYYCETAGFGLAATTPLSHRTGKPIVVSANRLRHTRARQLARLGMPKQVLSYWLGHSYEHSIDAYYNDPAEEARQINETMGAALVPLAMSFTGNLLDDESQASRQGSDSTLEFAHDKKLSSVGKCGKHSFCATTSVPVPCYRCKHFEPLVYAPHHEVLDALLTRQEEEKKMIKIGGTRRLLVPIDLSSDIRAVRACIARCDERKKELDLSNG